MKIRSMQLTDHPNLIKLFKETPGVSLRDADSYEATKRYLKRNPGLSFVAEEGETIVGCVMSGHDGRRGYLQHLIVKEDQRGKGLGEQLYNSCLNALAKEGIDKTHIFVFKDNSLANKFWAGKGWQLRNDVYIYSYISSDSKNA